MPQTGHQRVGIYHKTQSLFYFSLLLTTTFEYLQILTIGSQEPHKWKYFICIAPKTITR